MKKMILVDFQVILEVATFAAQSVGYASRSPRTKGQISPRRFAINLGLINQKTWDGAATCLRKTGKAQTRIDIREWAVTLAMGEEAASIAEWVRLVRNTALGGQAKAILFAEAFKKALRIEGKKGYHVSLAWLEAMCGEAGVDPGMLIVACKGYRPPKKPRKGVKLGAYAPIPIPEEFLDRNLGELRRMCSRMGKKASFRHYEDASQDMWEVVLRYGGQIVVAEKAHGTSDEDILRRLGGYLRACIPTVQSRYEYRHRREVGFAGGEDYREDADKRLADKDADTELQAILGSQTLEELCAEYGVDPETARALINDHLQTKGKEVKG